MSGVGKCGWVVLLLILCAPAAAHLSRGPGESHFSLRGWLLSVCHQRSPLRGTQRQNPQHPNEPFNALEQQNRSDSLYSSLNPGLLVNETISVPRFIFVFPGADRVGPVPDPAFLCTFLI